MNIVLYAHSLISDWNNGNAHFLRGIMGELTRRGHSTLVLEPREGWSRSNLVADQGDGAVTRFSQDFSQLCVTTYGPGFDHAAALDQADLVIVHEWTEPALVAEIGRLRRAGGRFTLLFHDTHHRGVSAAADIADLALREFDAILVFGETLRQRYIERGWGQQVFVWHEAADTSRFRPHPDIVPEHDLIWIGNWGDGERAAELDAFLIEPARRLGLSGSVNGVRYPDEALNSIRKTRLRYGGWIANADVPQAFARHRMTVHVPRRPYVEALPGIPTIRIFEALACGIPLICAPWQDSENLFSPGQDFLMARDSAEMTRHMHDLKHDDALAASLASHGLKAIRARHSCSHRVDELLAVVAQVGTARARNGVAA